VLNGFSTFVLKAMKYHPSKHFISVRCRADIPFYIGPTSALMSARYRMCITARSRTDVGCISNNHIGPMSSRLAFQHRSDIGFLPRSDISRRRFANILMSAQCRMCNTARCRTDVACISNNHISLVALHFHIGPTSAFNFGWISAVETLPTFPNTPFNPFCKSKTY